MRKKYTDLDRETDLRLVIDNGGTTTPEYGRLTERLIAFTDETSYVERLVAAVTGDADQTELDMLRALALAQTAASPVDRATVTNQVKAGISNLQRAELEKVATANYNHIREQFNDTADRYTRAHNIIPADTDPATLALAPEKTRKAWAEQQAAGGTLDNLAAALLAAARLAGHTQLDNASLPGLVFQIPEGVKRRPIWDAWENDRKRWTALITHGAVIHAPTLEDYNPIPAPEPITISYEQTNIGWRPVNVDPEDHLVNA